MIPTLVKIFEWRLVLTKIDIELVRKGLEETAKRAREAGEIFKKLFGEK